jgi:hypothetical protein
MEHIVRDQRGKVFESYEPVAFRAQRVVIKKRDYKAACDRHYDKEKQQKQHRDQHKVGKFALSHEEAYRLFS